MTPISASAMEGHCCCCQLSTNAPQRASHPSHSARQWLACGHWGLWLTHCYCWPLDWHRISLWDWCQQWSGPLPGAHGLQGEGGSWLPLGQWAHVERETCQCLGDIRNFQDHIALFFNIVRNVISNVQSSHVWCAFIRCGILWHAMVLGPSVQIMLIKPWLLATDMCITY